MSFGVAKEDTELKMSVGSVGMEGCMDVFEAIAAVVVDDVEVNVVVVLLP